MQTRYLLIVPHSHAGQLLFSQTPEGLALPAFERDDEQFWQTVDHVNALAREALGLHATTLRCVNLHHDATRNTRKRAYALELAELPPVLPPGTLWATPADARPLLAAGDQATLDTWLSWRDAPDARRVPWYTPGWHERAHAWLRRTLGPEVRAEQLRSWQRSALLLATAGERRYYLKGVPPFFAHELPLSAWLAERFPALCPAVEAMAPDAGLLLLREAPGTPLLDQQPALALCAAALRRCAELQIATLPHAAELQALGLPVRDEAWLCGGLDDLLEDARSLRSGSATGMSAEEVEQLRARGPALHAACAQLAACALPLALEHGDFGAWQILAEGEQLTLLDWSDAGLANPLFSLAGFLSELPPALDEPAAREQLIAAYLEPWRALVDDATLQRAWAASAELLGLYGALIYQREILPQMELAWEMENMLPFFARMLL